MLLAEILAGICDAAVNLSAHVIVHHDDRPAFYFSNDVANGIVFARRTLLGECVVVPRHHRLLVEPEHAVRRRSLIQIAVEWTVN